MFPGEASYQDQFDRELKNVMQLGYTVAGLGTLIIDERSPTITLRKRPTAYRVGHGLCIRACKSLRSILRLAPIGAGTEIAIIQRSLFETFVALNFVLQDSVPLSYKKGPNLYLTPDQRAEIYMGFIAVNRLEGLKKIQESDHAQGPLQSLDHTRFEDQIADVEKLIGPVWIDRFRKHPRTYSGLTLKELSAILGKDCDFCYALLYGKQSESVHAIDIEDHLRFCDAEQRIMARWQEPLDKVKTAVFSASTMMLICLKLLHHRFKFDGDTGPHIQLAMDFVLQIKDQLESPAEA